MRRKTFRGTSARASYGFKLPAVRNEQSRCRARVSTPPPPPHRSNRSAAPSVSRNRVRTGGTRRAYLSVRWKSINNDSSKTIIMEKSAKTSPRPAPHRSPLVTRLNCRRRWLTFRNIRRQILLLFLIVCYILYGAVIRLIVFILNVHDCTRYDGTRRAMSVPLARFTLYFSILL